MQNRNRKNTAICDCLPDSNQSARSSLKENIKLKHKGTLLIGSADCPDNLCGVWHFSTYTVVSFPSSQVIMQDEVASPGRNDHLVLWLGTWSVWPVVITYVRALPTPACSIKNTSITNHQIMNTSLLDVTSFIATYQWDNPWGLTMDKPITECKTDSETVLAFLTELPANVDSTEYQWADPMTSLALPIWQWTGLVSFDYHWWSDAWPPEYDKTAKPRP